MKNNQRKSKRDRTESLARQRELILWPFASYLEDHEDIDGLFDYMRHCGIDLKAIDTRTPNNQGVVNAILEHYQIGKRSYDIDRAANDLLRFPKIQARIAELRATTPIAT